MIAGVGGGIGEYFDLDPVLVRIAIVLLAIFANGLGVLLYIAAWILMPKAPATEGDATPDATEPAGRRGSAAPPPGAPSSTGTILLGVLLVAAGALALLWRLDVPLPGWGVVLSVLLILTGLAILFEARRGLHGGLVVLALFLTLLLGFTSTLNFGFATFGGVESGFGERNEAPVSFDDLESEYSHAFGSMNIDLSDVEFPEGTTELEIRIAFGEVTVNLPDDVGVRGEASTVFGNTETLGRESRGGVLADDSFEWSGYADAERRIELDISTLFGQARVQ